MTTECPFCGMDNAYCDEIPDDDDWEDDDEDDDCDYKVRISRH